jgi:hypothetical protein
MALVNPTVTTVVKSIQRGFVNATGTITDVTISTVNLAKTRVQYNGVFVSGASTDSDFSGNIRLLNATTLRIEYQTATATSRQTGWEIVEFF